MPTVPPHSHREFRTAAKSNSGWYPYLYQGTNVTVDPGPGGITIQTGSGNVRTIAVSKLDADGGLRTPTLLQAGDTVTLTDDPTTPPITGWVRYVLTEDPVDQGQWVTAEALRTDQIGSSNPPPVGSRLRVYTTWSATGNYYLTVPGGDARYVNNTGDTMTGELILPGTPASSLGATPKSYVDTVASNEADAAEAAAKAYADTGDSSVRSYVDTQDAKQVSKTGDSMSGNLTIQDRLIAGAIWGGTWRGLQNTDTSSDGSRNALLLGNSSGTGPTYVIGNSTNGTVNIRPYGNTSYEAVFSTSGLTLPSVQGTTDAHAARRDLVTKDNPVNGLNIQSGSVELTSTGGNSTNTVVTFPKAFSSTPVVMLTSEDGMSNTSVTCFFWVASKSATQVDIRMVKSNTNAHTIRWIAFGPTT